ncbi:YkvI family membrane protein [Corynebacterium auris]|uniref:YkvI family membrane protein n=1 Tax=Corynebacterium auris TaxID=44750 RepID=UPI0025B619C7|nr:hypothetical protein [Corynebacterium auris]WJY67111.1 hypothetical protein CAURIS_00850 [Corynebacterium auris]
MLRNAIGISFAFIGVLVGAGFASGQEAMQYFVAFGTQGFWGAILSAALMLIGGISVLELGSYFQAQEHMEVLGRISGKVVSWILDIATITTLFSIGFVMFAGAGSNLNQQFGLPVWVGALIMLVLVMGIGMLDVDKVTGAIGFLTPFLVIFVVAGCTWTIVNASPDWTALNQSAEQVSTTLPSWWVSSLNYTGLNFICVTSMAIVIGGNYLDPRAAGVGGALGGLGYLVMLLLLCGALLVSVDSVAGQDMPTLTLINEINPTLGLVMSFIIFGMIFATALGMFYALGKRLSRGRTDKFRVIFISACLLGFVLSFAGFQNLVSYVYPVLGYMGVVLIVVVSVAWLRGSQILRQEGTRRRRALELTRIKLDPRRRFTKKNRDELAVITASSNVADASFIEAIEDEVGQELLKDDEVDFDPNDPSGEIVYVSYSEPSGPEEHVTAAQDIDPPTEPAEPTKKDK